MIRFLHEGWAPALFAALAVLATAVLAAGFGAGRRRKVLVGAGPRLPGLARDACLLCALSAVALAFLGPRIGTRIERSHSSGVDLVVLIDVSSSMEAKDVPPSRLDRARRNAERVLAGLDGGDRAALAVFAGHGVALTPLTSDVGALLDVLTAIDGSLLRARGSDLGDGLRAALSVFDAASARPKLLLLLSDGEDPARRPVDAGTATAAGVTILAVALGTPEGTSIPDGDLPLRDGAGEVVRSRADPARLAALAEETGGARLATDDFGALDVAGTLARIRRDAAGAGGEPATRVVPAVRVAPFAAAAFLLMALEVALPRGFRRDRSRRRGALWMAASTLLGVLWTGPGRAGADAPSETARLETLEALAASRPGDASVWVRLGVARAEAGRDADARRTFLAAALSAKDPELSAMAFYDLGVAALGAGALETARDAFLDVLALDPADDEARFNLEWALRALRETPPPPSESKDATGRDGETAARAGDAPGPEGRPGGEAPAEGRGKGDGPGGAEGAKPGDARPTEAEGGKAPLLGEAEAARWLDALNDDPGRALRDAARRAAAARPPARGPGW